MRSIGTSTTPPKFDHLCPSILHFPSCDDPEKNYPNISWKLYWWKVRSTWWAISSGTWQGRCCTNPSDFIHDINLERAWRAYVCDSGRLVDNSWTPLLHLSLVFCNIHMLVRKSCSKLSRVPPSSSNIIVSSAFEEVIFSGRVTQESWIRNPVSESLCHHGRLKNVMGGKEFLLRICYRQTYPCPKHGIFSIYLM